MRLMRTARFKRAYRKLSEQEQERVKKALHLLLADRSHPSLQVKRIKGTVHIWEVRVSRGIRLTFQIEGDAYVLRNVGPHDKALKMP